jgi:putative transposase
LVSYFHYTRGPRGYDGGKKVKGRKRHILVETQGFVLKAMVHTADIHDRDGGRLLLEQDMAQHFPRLCHLWVDIGYRGRFVRWVEETLHWTVAVSRHWWQGIRTVWVAPEQEAPTYPAGFQVLLWRWIVERTLAWINFSRRLSKDYELPPSTGETWIYLAMSRLMVRRLAHSFS